VFRESAARPVYAARPSAIRCLDLCLHIIRADHGEEIARKVAPSDGDAAHRDGGQSQYVDAPIRVRPADTLAPLLDELADELDIERTVETLAARSAMSPRTFARRFRDRHHPAPG
jgi:AraC family transcriptional regulator, transcriptional activator FtrA